MTLTPFEWYWYGTVSIIVVVLLWIGYNIMRIKKMNQKEVEQYANKPY